MKIRITGKFHFDQYRRFALLIFVLILVSLARNQFLIARADNPDQEPLTLNPVADTFVTEANANGNNGRNIALRIDASPVINSYLRFEIPALPGPVGRATLRIFASSSSSTGYDVHGTENGWAETELTFANAPAMAPAVGGSGSFTEGSWTSVDVTRLVTGVGEISFVLTTSDITAMRLSSREDANMPELIVEIVGSLQATEMPTATEVLPPTATPTLVPTATATLVPTATPTLLPTSTPLPPPTLTPEPLAAQSLPTSSVETWYVYSRPGQAVNGRACPRLTCRVVATLLYGEAVQVIGVTEGDEFMRSTRWLQLEHRNSSEVYVHSSLLRRNPPGR